MRPDFHAVEATPDAEAPLSDEDWFRDGASSVTESERFSGVKRSKLYELIHAGRLVSTKVDGKRLIARRSLVALLAEGLER